MNRKLVIGISIGAGVLIIGTAVVYPAVMRSQIRKRLDEAYNDPSGVNSVGGLNKLLVTEVFNPTTYQQSGKATISLMDARERSDQIWDAYSSWFGSDTTSVISAFNGLGHVHDVSKISHEFKAAYGYELLSIIKSALPKSKDYNILLGKINQLPKD